MRKRQGELLEEMCSLSRCIRPSQNGHGKCVKGGVAANQANAVLIITTDPAPAIAPQQAIARASLRFLAYLLYLLERAIGLGGIEISRRKATDP